MLNHLRSFLMIAACLHTRLRPDNGPKHPQAAMRSVDPAFLLRQVRRVASWKSWAYLLDGLVVHRRGLALGYLAAERAVGCHVDALRHLGSPRSWTRINGIFHQGHMRAVCMS